MWQTIVAIAAIDAVWLLATPLRLSAASITTICQLAVCVPCGLWLSQLAAGRANLRTVLIGGTMLLAAWPALRIFNHITMTTAFPLADEWLSRWDRIVGFDWMAYMSWLDDRPELMRLMGQTYGGLTHYSGMLFVVLALGRDAEARGAEFIKLFLITAVVCMTAGMLFPALAASIYYAPPG